MATKKQKREIAANKRAEFEESLRVSGLEAQGKDHAKREAEKENARRAAERRARKAYADKRAAANKERSAKLIESLAHHKESSDA